MPRLFGTDGIRGVANDDLKPTIAFALGRATAHRLVQPGGAIVVGQDTRRSGDMFVAAITAGATSLGVDVHRVGVVPTPALAFVAGEPDFAAGIMVSASHNPAEDNGLKVLDGDGLKLDDAIEDELEQLIWRTDELAGVGNDRLGIAVDASDRVEHYVAHRRGLAARIGAEGLRVVLDCANGSACGVAPGILGATGASVEVIHDAPDGVNINLRAGATDPASLAERVVATGADVGFALDGDADRLIAVDAAGTVVDGDQILGVLALERLARGALAGDTLVVSILSNGGLQSAVEAAGGAIVRTPVGDKYILEGMQVSGAGLGGEKSGHVIVWEHATSGDGILTALEVLRVMTAAGASLRDLAATIPLLPQEQRAVKVRHKDQWEGDRALGSAIRSARERL
ncbi:MAG TPA: phosphoglucosamine mutase, partial [Candidatus Limnocylindrales bacterium]